MVTNCYTPTKKPEITEVYIMRENNSEQACKPKPENVVMEPREVYLPTGRPTQWYSTVPWTTIHEQVNGKAVTGRRTELLSDRANFAALSASMHFRAFASFKSGGATRSSTVDPHVYRHLVVIGKEKG